MNCEQMFDIMPGLLNKTLGDKEEREALMHLMECQECRQELAFWTKVSDIQPDFEKEFTAEDQKKIYEELTRREPGALVITKQAVKVYFKVIETILNI